MRPTADERIRCSGSCCPVIRAQGRQYTLPSLNGERSEGETGVWFDVGTEKARKICALGVKNSRWVTMHGFALNISTDLDYFRGMIPCGIFECGVTSINEITTNKLSIDQIAKLYSKYFLKNLKRNLSNEITQF